MLDHSDSIGECTIILSVWYCNITPTTRVCIPVYTNKHDIQSVTMSLIVDSLVSIHKKSYTDILHCSTDCYASSKIMM